MRGVHRVVVHSKRLHYDFELKRNLTIIRGDSATGKTTLIDMIQEYVSNPSGSPVELVCDKACYVLAGALWKEQLSGMHDGIVFIDEGNEFVRSDDFASEIQQTDNYYVIVSREALPALPYSVTEIYGIRTSGKYGTLKPCYHEFYRIYGADVTKKELKPEAVITEDSNAGYQFFYSICMENNIECYSAGGKTKIFHCLNMNRNGKVLVIADGAAFGPEIDRVMNLIRERGNAALYLPESFEWLILSSELLRGNEIKNILNAPSEHIECQKFFSWERYFTVLLVEKTKDTFLSYAKRLLNRNYLSPKSKTAIMAVMEGIDIGDKNEEQPHCTAGKNVLCWEQEVVNMTKEDKKDFNAMLNDSKDMPKFQRITDEKSIEKYGGDRMYFAPPIDYDKVMRRIPWGRVITIGKIREYFAKLSGADFTEPITAGIFVSIAAWASYQRTKDETPYWRTLKADGELNSKYPGGIETQKEKLEAEGHVIIQKGRKNIRYYVKDYEKFLYDLK